MSLVNTLLIIVTALFFLLIGYLEKRSQLNSLLGDVWLGAGSFLLGALVALHLVKIAAYVMGA